MYVSVFFHPTCDLEFYILCPHKLIQNLAIVNICPLFLFCCFLQTMMSCFILFTPALFDKEYLIPIVYTQKGTLWVDLWHTCFLKSYKNSACSVVKTFTFNNFNHYDRELQKTSYIWRQCRKYNDVKMTTNLASSFIAMAFIHKVPFCVVKHIFIFLFFNTF